MLWGGHVTMGVGVGSTGIRAMLNLFLSMITVADCVRPVYLGGAASRCRVAQHARSVCDSLSNDSGHILRP